MDYGAEVGVDWGAKGGMYCGAEVGMDWCAEVDIGLGWIEARKWAWIGAWRWA